MTIYNKKALLHYNRYWTLGVDEPEIKEMAENILSKYVQNWGQLNKERLDTLKDVANKIGFHIEVIDCNNEYVFKVIETETERFNSFRDKIRNIRRGNFEGEVVQIASIIKEFLSKKKWWQFWK